MFHGLMAWFHRHVFIIGRHICQTFCTLWHTNFLTFFCYVAQTEGRYQESLDKAKHSLKLVENSSDDEIQNKPELIASIHSSIGNAYLELGKTNQAMDHHERDLDIARD